MILLSLFFTVFSIIIEVTFIDNICFFFDQIRGKQKCLYSLII